MPSPRRRSPASRPSGLSAAVLAVLGVAALEQQRLRRRFAERRRPQIALAPGGRRAARRRDRVRRPGRSQLAGRSARRGDNLLAHPDSYAELGGLTLQTATAMGGLPYMTPLRITWGGHSAIAYKRDFGLGGGPIDGLPRVIDLWWQLAGGLGIPYENGQWSGPVRIERPPAAGRRRPSLGQTPRAAR